MAGRFDHYLFADYSGGGLHGTRQANIRLWCCNRDGAARRVMPARGTNFSRALLAEHVGAWLDRATKAGGRVVFGFDHQFGWPPALQAAARIDALPWRDALRALRDGLDGRPKLSEPRTYCAAFNRWAGAALFWSPLRTKASLYGIGGSPPTLTDDTRFRVTERPDCARAVPPGVVASPKPADAVGGMGIGIVGGQTICGLRWLADLVERSDVAWWPFDGLRLESSAYEGKHVGVEVYPSALRPRGVPQTDDNDAEHSARYVHAADVAGRLHGVMDISTLSQPMAAQVRREGWILGLAPVAQGTTRSAP